MSTRVERALEAAAADTTNSFIALHEAAPGLPPVAGPLAGTPIAVKDLIDHSGHVTTAGSGFYRHRAALTAPALARLEAAGAVVIGRTGLHEFAFGFSSENPWFGPVRNPWDPTLSPGGSSGGSAAAVASGIVPVALGTDTGGSIRVPAALCGVFGLKVTHGLIPLEGVFPLVPSLDTVGAIAASLDDLARVTAHMAGDGWPHDETMPADRVRLVVPDRWVDEAPSTRQVTDAFEEFLGSAGAADVTVEHRDLQHLAPSPHQGGIIGPEVAAIHRTWREAGRPYGADVGERVDAALAIATDAQAMQEAQTWREELTRQMAAATSDDTLVVTPSVAAMDKVIGEDRLGDRHYRTVLSWFSAPVNPTGHPAISLPLAGPGRRPSVQLIGSRRSEARLLAVARMLEKRGVVRMSRLPSGRLPDSPTI
ncbi:MAG TPA: amidase [Acidimicrobiia bacterium]|nr:amidase [Acidimicrobiia bacterium]